MAPELACFSEVVDLHDTGNARNLPVCRGTGLWCDPGDNACWLQSDLTPEVQVTRL